MPFYTALIAALGAFLFWYVFLRQPPRQGDGQDASAQTPASSGAPLPPPQAAPSPVTLINDPISATTAFLIALALAENQLDDEAEAVIKHDVTHVMGVEKVDDLFDFARNAAAQVTDPSNLLIRFARIWVSDLDAAQRQDIYDMAARVASLHGGPTDLQAVCLKQLAGRLGVAGA